MEIKNLEYIIAIAEEGSVSKAAARLYLAQSSLSQFLARYESELGTKLFIRTASGMRPTNAGDLFIESAKRLVQQYQHLCSELRETEHPKSGHIEFGISSYRGAALFPPILKHFQLEYPSVEIVIHEHDSVVLQKKIAMGELDMALIALRAGQKQPEGTPVMQDEVYLVANRAHPIMEYCQVGNGGPSRPWVDIRDAARFEFLLSNRFTILGSIAQQQFDYYGITPIVVNGNLTAPFAAEMARQGLGLAFTYGSCAVPGEDVVYLSIGKSRCYVDLMLIYPTDGYRSRANLALEDMIRQHIGQVGALEHRLPLTGHRI